MMIMRILVVKLLYEMVMGEVPTLECLLQAHMSACCYVWSCVTLNDHAT
jgi:hypothetical protein